MSRCSTLKCLVVVSFYKVNSSAGSFYYKDLYSEVNSSTIKSSRAGSWQDVLVWKQMFTKFEKEIIFVWKTFRFSIIRTKHNYYEAVKDFQIFAVLEIKKQHDLVVCLFVFFNSCYIMKTEPLKI